MVSRTRDPAVSPHVACHPHRVSSRSLRVPPRAWRVPSRVACPLARGVSPRAWRVPSRVACPLARGVSSRAPSHPGPKACLMSAKDLLRRLVRPWRQHLLGQTCPTGDPSRSFGTPSGDEGQALWMTRNTRGARRPNGHATREGQAPEWTHNTRRPRARMDTQHAKATRPNGHATREGQALEWTHNTRGARRSNGHATRAKTSALDVRPEATGHSSRSRARHTHHPRRR